MPIRFACECHKQLSTRDELAGKKIKCPACGKQLTVPASQVGAVDDDEVGLLSFANEKPKTCPSCQKNVPGDAVLCVSCGYDWRTAKKVRTQAETDADAEEETDCRIQLSRNWPFHVCWMSRASLRLEAKNRVIVSQVRGNVEFELARMRVREIASVGVRELSKGARAARLFMHLTYLGMQVTAALLGLLIAWDVAAGKFEAIHALYALGIAMVGGPALGLIFCLFGVWWTIAGKVNEFSFHGKLWGKARVWIPTSEADRIVAKLKAAGLKVKCESNDGEQ